MKKGRKTMETKLKKKPGPKPGLKKTAEEPIQVYFTVEQKLALQKKCEADGITVSAYIRQLLVDAGVF